MTDVNPKDDEVRNHELAEQDDRRSAETAAEGETRPEQPQDERLHSEKPAEG